MAALPSSLGCLLGPCASAVDHRRPGGHPPWCRRARRRTRPPRRSESTGSPAAARCSRPADVGVHHRGVALAREDQGDVDVDARRDRLRDGRQAGHGGRDLDHQVRPVHPLPEPLGLGQRAVGVVGQVRVDLQADVAVAAVALVVQRPEQVGGRLDVLDRQLPEDLLRAAGRPWPAAPARRRNPATW